MATGFSGFSEEDLRRIRLQNEEITGDEPAQTAQIKQAKLNGSTKKVAKGKIRVKLNEKSSSVNVLTRDEMLAMDLPASAENNKQNNVNNGGTNVKLRLKQDGHSVEVVQEKLADCNVVKAIENGENVADKMECPVKKMSVEEFEWRQRMIEEQNARRRELLAKALADRRKKTIAETEKLSYIQQELEKLNSLVSNDVAILRNHIEIASMEFSQVQKRYERAEKEFVEAKLELYRKMDRKEQLTEHLCTIIEQNELRKAKKLAELMSQLQIESLAEELNFDDQEPVLSHLCLLNETNFVTTIKSPSKVSEISSQVVASGTGTNGAGTGEEAAEVCS